MSINDITKNLVTLYVDTTEHFDDDILQASSNTSSNIYDLLANDFNINDQSLKICFYLSY